MYYILLTLLKVFWQSFILLALAWWCMTREYRVVKLFGVLLFRGLLILYVLFIALSIVGIMALFFYEGVPTYGDPPKPFL